MARKCDICGKGSQTGNNVSHSHLKTKKRWKPNVKKVKIIKDGTTQSAYVCSRCLRSGKVSKPHTMKNTQAKASV